MSTNKTLDANIAFLSSRWLPVRIVLFASLIATVSCAQTSRQQKSTGQRANNSVPSAYSQTNYQIWQNDYQTSLAEPDGWLSLAGLYWLEPGLNTLGSAKENMHRLPQHAPSYVGTLKVENQTGDFMSSPNQMNDQIKLAKQVALTSPLTHLKINGQFMQNGILSVEDETVVDFNSFRFYLIERENRLAIRLIDYDSKARKQFKGTQFYPFDKQHVIKAQLIRNKTPKLVNVATVYGTTRKEKSAGIVHFQYKGHRATLEAIDYGDDSPLYLLFSDQTNGSTTYPAGRYLQIDRPNDDGSEDSQVWIDFNRAYNPPCAFTEYATCPLTPTQNRLEFPINAGELNYQKTEL